MLNRHTYNTLTWIDAVSPTADEVRTLVHEFTLDGLVAEELLMPSARNRVDARHDYLYLVLHFPAYTETNAVANASFEIDFIVGRTWIITTRYSTFNLLHGLPALLEVETALSDKRERLGHAGVILYHMLVMIYTTLSDKLAQLATHLDTVEERIFGGYEKEMVRDLSCISRDILNYSQALDSHRDILESLETPSASLFGYEYVRNVRSVAGDFERLAAALRSNRASLEELRETNNSLLTTKQSEIMKTFTIMAFVTFPLSLFAAIFGMNTITTPIIGHPHDFWIIVGIMLSAALVFFAYFKYKRWL